MGGSTSDGDSDAGAESRTEIMEATSRALCEHGYAELTLQDIADEVGKSTSLLHYHFDTKEELLVSFVDYLLAEFRETMVPPGNAPPKERLEEFLDLFVIDPDEDERAALHLALLEFRSRGPFNEAYREQLARSDELLRSTVADILRDGIEDGTFRTVDPDATARLIVAAVDGARTRQITLDDETYTTTVRTELQSQVVEPLLAGDADWNGSGSDAARTERSEMNAGGGGNEDSERSRRSEDSERNEESDGSDVKDEVSEE